MQTGNDKATMYLFKYSELATSLVWKISMGVDVTRAPEGSTRLHV